MNSDFGGSAFDLKWKQQTSGGRGPLGAGLWRQMTDGRQLVNHFKHSGELCTKGTLPKLAVSSYLSYIPGLLMNEYAHVRALTSLVCHQLLV